MFYLINRSLRIKFSLIVASILLLIFSLSAFFIIKQSSTFQKESLIARAQNFAVLSTKPLGSSYNLYHNSGLLKLNSIFRQTLLLNVTVPRIQVISVTGDILYDTNNLDTGVDLEKSNQVKVEEPSVLQAVVAGHVSNIKDSKGNITEIIAPYADDLGSRPFSLRYFVSYDSINTNINQAIITAIILNIILFIVTLLTITFLINQSIISPIEKINNVARAIEKGDLDQKIEVNTKDELEDLASSLNQMTTTLKNSILELKNAEKLKDEFIAIASHNLRTPITVISGYVPILREKHLDDESGKFIDAIDEAAQKLAAVSESLINIVSFEGATKTLTKNPENLVQIVQALIDKYQNLANQRHIKLQFFSSEHEVRVSVDLARIKLAIGNVIQNAIKFNKENGLVNIDLASLDNEIILSISDTGIGISPEESKNIFTKFHRATSYMNYNYEGVGLGLYLSKIIVEAHLGKIWVTSNLGQGTNVYISLPVGG